MHILVNGWFCGQQTAGSGQYLYFLLPQMAQELLAAQEQPSAHITVLLPAGAEPTFAQPLPANVTLRQQKLPTLSKNLAKLWWEQISVPAAARQLQADLLWVPYWAAPWWQPVPTAVTVHDVIQLILPAYRGGLLNRLYTRLVAATARKSASIIAVSHASKRDIVQLLGVPESRVHVVHHGPNVEATQLLTTHHALRTKYNLPERYFLYLGGFDVRKNLRGILAAYQRYLESGGDPGIKLLIAGKLPATDSAFLPDPRPIAAELGLTEQVHFCGWVDDADKAALYAAATAFLFPTLYEGFGMMVLEAQAAGAPVISSA